MDLSVLKTYGALREKASYIQLESDLKRIEEIESVFECIPNRENRYCFRLYCMGYSYGQIVEMLQKNNIYYSYSAVRSKVDRVIKRLTERGVISDDR